MINLLNHILEFRNYRIDESDLIINIKDYCDKNDIHLYYEEIKIIPIALNIILINKLSELCQKENINLKEKSEVNNIIKKIQKQYLQHKNLKLEKYLTDEFYKSATKIVYFNEKIKDFGKFSNQIFKQFNNYLEDNNISLRKTINKNHLNNTDDNILVSNIFYSIQKIDNIEIENLYCNLCNVEKILNNDPYYKLMTLETKNLYRKKLISLAKKKNIEKLAKQLIKKDKNIGSVLFPHKNIKFKTYIYLLLITFLSIYLTIISVNYFIPNKFLGFIILFIPISEIVITFINKIYLKFYPPKPMAKLDFEKGIPKNCSTMVVIPTILKNKEKVDEVFTKLEAYYLANKSKNLYFTLLGDACECKSEKYEKDEEIKKQGILKVQELNKKYNHEIFYFAYRTRKYNKGENSFLGFERKRGALPMLLT